MPRPPLTPFLPDRINTGPWVAGYSLTALRARVPTDRIVLPICSLGTPPEALAGLAPLVLPPLYHEALDAGLKRELLAQIHRCFPYYEGTGPRARWPRTVAVVELPPRPPPRPAQRPRVLAFSTDPAIEQHGPHLPLATDTIQSYGVLHRLAAENPAVSVGPPLDYGQLTWGLPFGLSIDVTPPLLTRLVQGFANALVDWLAPASLYVVDVHGSLIHRTAVEAGLRGSRSPRWAFRWLHDPLGEFSTQRGDQHAGGVETTLVGHIAPALVDARWWPGRTDELVAGQMTMAEAVALSADLREFIRRVETHPFNGIVGDVRNAFTLDAAALFDRMVRVAHDDVKRLTGA